MYDVVIVGCGPVGVRFACTAPTYLRLKPGGWQTLPVGLRNPSERRPVMVLAGRLSRMSKALPKGGSALCYVQGYERPAFAGQASAKRRRSPVPKEPSWEEAIQIVLRDAGGMMRYTEIGEQISARQLKKSANASASVAATLSSSLRDQNSPFLRLGKGEYTLRESIAETSAVAQASQEIPENEADAGALQAFGMFWRRDQILWTGRPRLLGRQGLGATNVNFSEQVGVYLLHDRERVIYVGRATEALFTRLKFHTTDRLSGRWDRLSWFGLRAVRSDGTLAEPSGAWSHTVVVETLEALLIETLEPPLNRKRGDNFSGSEYVQVADPEIERRLKRKLLIDMADNYGSIDESRAS